MNKSKIKQIVKAAMTYEKDSLDEIKDKCNVIEQTEIAAEPQQIGISKSKNGAKPTHFLKPILLGFGACAIAVGGFSLALLTIQV